MYASDNDAPAWAGGQQPQNEEFVFQDTTNDCFYEGGQKQHLAPKSAPSPVSKQQQRDMWSLPSDPAATPEPEKKELTDLDNFLSQQSTNQADSPEAAVVSPLRSCAAERKAEETPDALRSTASFNAAQDTAAFSPPSFSTPFATPSSRSQRHSERKSAVERKLQVSKNRVAWLKIKSKFSKIRQAGRSSTAVVKEPFELSYEQLQETQVFIEKMLKDTRTYFTWQKRSHTASMGLSIDLHTFYLHPDVNVPVHASGGRGAATREIISDFSAVCDACDKNSEESFAYYERHVIAPLESWLNDFATLKPKVEELRESQMIFAHYTTKVDSLTTAAERYSQSDKPQNEKANMKMTERLARNSTKLDNAKEGFAAANRDLIQEMQRTYENRFDALAPVVQGHVQFHRERTEAYAMKADRADAFYNQ